MEETKKQLKRSHDVAFDAKDEVVPGVSTPASPGQASTTQPDQGAEVSSRRQKEMRPQSGRATAGVGRKQHRTRSYIGRIEKNSRREQPPSMTNQILVAGGGGFVLHRTYSSKQLCCGFF